VNPAGLREEHEPALLSAGTIILIRQTLCACSRVLAWARNHGDPLRDVITAAETACIRRHTPCELETTVNLTIDYLDFAPAADRAHDNSGEV
jgi:hypothetical protein